MDTATQILKTRRWVLFASIASVVLLIWALLFSPVPLLFTLSVAALSAAIYFLIHLIAQLVARYIHKDQGPVWRPGDKK